jgi:hypothetical protein
MLRLVERMAVVAWLVLVGANYTALFLFPPPPNAMSQAPAPPDLSAASLPLLAALLILGIIRRFVDSRRPPAAGSDG